MAANRSQAEFPFSCSQTTHMATARCLFEAGLSSCCKTGLKVLGQNLLVVINKQQNNMRVTSVENGLDYTFFVAYFLAHQLNAAKGSQLIS